MAQRSALSLCCASSFALHYGQAVTRRTVGITQYSLNRYRLEAKHKRNVATAAVGTCPEVAPTEEDESGAQDHGINPHLATVPGTNLSEAASSVTPKQLVQEDLALVHKQIRECLLSRHPLLHDSACHYFDQAGKNVRPIVLLLMARACSRLLPPDHPDYGKATGPQRTLAQIAEMIHTSSLVHDDVIDFAETRRGKMSVNAKYGDRQAIYAGDLILARASVELAGLGNPKVVTIMSTIIDDLVKGEFMQLLAETNPKKRFQKYLQKTCFKTASLLAYGCEAVVAVTPHSPSTCQMAQQYGRDLGMAFQLIDDYLDFVSTAQHLGKPALADMKLGLATAPVLYATEEHPELNKMISRRFLNKGDVEKATELVFHSQGLAKTKQLAFQYGNSAAGIAAKLPACAERDGLVAMTQMVLDRSR